MQILFCLANLSARRQRGGCDLLLTAEQGQTLGARVRIDPALKGQGQVIPGDM